MIGIADSGFLVAFLTRRDRHSAWAQDLANRFSESLLTCEAVLAETSYQLRNSALVFRLLDTGLIRLAFAIDEHRAELARLAERYADRAPDLADLCLIRMSELNPRHPIVTVDGDFRVYRRNQREAIPVLMPPDLAA